MICFYPTRDPKALLVLQLQPLPWRSLRLVRWLLVSIFAISRILLSIFVITSIFVMHTLCICIPVPSVRRGLSRGIDFVRYRTLLFILGFVQSTPSHSISEDRSLHLSAAAQVLVDICGQRAERHRHNFQGAQQRLLRAAGGAAPLPAMPRRVASSRRRIRAHAGTARVPGLRRRARSRSSASARPCACRAAAPAARRRGA